MPRYPYQALNLPHETRIVNIQPGKFQDDIICSISHMPLENAPAPEPYEALSYCWGKSTNVEFIPPDDTLVAYAYGSEDGQHGSIPFRDMLDHPELHRTYVTFGGQLPRGTIICDGTPVEVGGELHRAIRRIRSEDEPLRIWIDALCIDQDNVAERNKHVLVMGAIYAGAAHVRIWLGEDTGVESLGLQVLSGILDIARESISDAEFSTLRTFEIRKRLLTNPKTAELDWESLELLFNRAWFRRIWVLQEAANATRATVHIGSGSEDWDWLAQSMHFARTFKLDTVLRSFAMKSLSVMQWLRDARAGPKAPISVPLLDILEETRVFDSTVPADKIYAVLALACRSVRVPVDYAARPEDVFTGLAVEFLQETGSLDVLSHCMLPATTSSLRLPSLLATVEAIESTRAITRLADTPEGMGAPTYGLRRVDAGTASLPHGTSLPERNHSRRLHHMGEARAALLDIYGVASPGGAPTPEVREAMARTFACGRTREQAPLGPDFLLGFDLHGMVTCADETFEGACRWMVQEATGASETSREGRAFHKRMTRAYEQLAGSHERWCFNRRFARTTRGLGWVVNGAQIGDVVVLLYGGNYPFVLREQGKDRYVMVGDCYLDQYMDGEGLGSEFEEQEFVII
ncbi:Heterokaryon incompatibility [Cordyceps fumosorosea ARSEF 2679]|uniref:Heterokaryon incompatibility n=1 Tax=Cordyceps fumosorosea (strain ARSEF 2679) TaxID=1081104 RepID=A0A167Q4V4_CORFA|nr:Heterokaryon incompatibility [Cordyceps fumosorosea ARSEF 2679]OAA57293.1 Heterokaryon incompatibility [Cordyceps fumosorosea ARSEF 2679]